MTHRNILYCKLEVQSKSLGFSKGLQRARSEVKKLEITWIHHQATQGVSLEFILKSYKVA